MRNFTKESPITYCFTSKLCPLIKIDADRNTSYYSTKSQKVSALLNREDTDKFILAWGGQWSTDVFEVTEKDIEEALANYL